MSIGGNDLTNGINAIVETTLATANPPIWTTGVGSTSDLNHHRHAHDVVLLPDTTILIIGGEQTCGNLGGSANPALIPELLEPSMNVWRDMAAHTIIRDYHATALLLPGGQVLTGGGDNRDYIPNPACTPKDSNYKIPGNPKNDYQVFVPHYLNCGYAQPTVTNFATAGGTLVYEHGKTYGITYTSLSLGNTISKVVLMRAGSVTHQADNNQRCYQLSFVSLPDVDPPTGVSALQVTVPTVGSRLLPRGYYMLFLVTSQGGISKPATGTAPWVQVTK